MKLAALISLTLLPLAISSEPSLAAQQPLLLYQVDHPEPGPPQRALGGIATASQGQLILADRSAETSIQGSVYVLDSTTGSLQQTFRNPRLQEPTTTGFGGSVAAANGLLAVGAQGYDLVSPVLQPLPDAGAVYLYSLETGSLIHTIENPFPLETEEFGSSLVLTDDFLAVANTSIPHPSTPDRLPGTLVEVFDVATGAHRFSLTDPLLMNGNTTTSLGVIDGDLLAASVTPPQNRDAGPGTLFRFDGQTGEVLQTYRSPIQDGSARHFGFSYATANDQIIIGSPRLSFGGSLFVFDADSGDLLHTIDQPETDRDAFFFGGDVVIVGDMIVTSTLSRGGPSQVYVYDRFTKNLLSTFEHPFDSPQNRFAETLVGLGDERLYVGSPTFTGVASGFVYDLSVLRVPEPTTLLMVAGGVVILASTRRRQG